MEENNINILPMTINHLDTIAHILETDFDNFWNYNIFKSELQNPNSKYFIAISNNEIIGFAGVLIVFDEADITNIVVKKSYRGNKISNLLMEKLIRCCSNHNCKKINLEVNSKNKIAITLYKNFGFEQIGCRKNYYKTADALLFTKHLA